MQRMIAVTAKLQILYPFIFYSYLTNFCSNMHKFWGAYRSMGLLTTHQNSTQTDTVCPSKQFIYQNCSVLKWLQPELTKHLSNPMFYSTNTQTNLRHWRVLSKEWDHQVWSKSNFVWVTNRRLGDNRFSATKSGQILCSFFSLLPTLRCVLYSRSLCIAAAVAPFSKDVD